MCRVQASPHISASVGTQVRTALLCVPACLLSQGPYSILSIDLEHPDRQSNFQKRYAHPTQAVPGREGIGNNSRQLQDRCRNRQDGETEGNQQEPEVLSQEAEDTENHDSDKRQKSNQKQRDEKRIALCWRRGEHERSRVDGWRNSIEHDHKQSTPHEKGHQCLFQSSLNKRPVMKFIHHYPP